MMILNHVDQMAEMAAVVTMVKMAVFKAEFRPEGIGVSKVKMVMGRVKVVVEGLKVVKVPSNQSAQQSIYITS